MGTRTRAYALCLPLIALAPLAALPTHKAAWRPVKLRGVLLTRVRGITRRFGDTGVPARSVSFRTESP